MLQLRQSSESFGGEFGKEIVVQDQFLQFHTDGREGVCLDVLETNPVNGQRGGADATERVRLYDSDA